MFSNFGSENHIWVEAVRTTCYLINQSPTTTLDGGIIEEVWTGKTINYSHPKNLDVNLLCVFPKSIEPT